MAGSQQRPSDDVLGRGRRLRRDEPRTVRKRKVLTWLATITVAITLTVVVLPEPASATTGTITRLPDPGCLNYPKYSFYSTPGSVSATPGAASYWTNIGVSSTDQWTTFQLVVKYYSGGRWWEIRGSTLWSHNGWPSSDGVRWIQTPEGQWYNLSLDEHRSYYAEGFSQVVLPSRGYYYLYGIYVWHPIYNSTTSAMLDPGGSYTWSFGQRYCA